MSHIPPRIPSPEEIERIFKNEYPWLWRAVTSTGGIRQLSIRRLDDVSVTAFLDELWTGRFVSWSRELWMHAQVHDHQETVNLPLYPEGTPEIFVSCASNWPDPAFGPITIRAFAAVRIILPGERRVGSKQIVETEEVYIEIIRGKREVDLLKAFRHSQLALGYGIPPVSS